jgi:hypothetical protein
MALGNQVRRSNRILNRVQGIQAPINLFNPVNPIPINPIVPAQMNLPPAGQANIPAAAQQGQQAANPVQGQAGLVPMGNIMMGQPGAIQILYSAPGMDELPMLITGDPHFPVWRRSVVTLQRMHRWPDRDAIELVKLRCTRDQQLYNHLEQWLQQRVAQGGAQPTLVEALDEIQRKITPSQAELVLRAQALRGIVQSPAEPVVSYARRLEAEFDQLGADFGEVAKQSAFLAGLLDQLKVIITPTAMNPSTTYSSLVSTAKLLENSIRQGLIPYNPISQSLVNPPGGAIAATYPTGVQPLITGPVQTVPLPHSGYSHYIGTAMPLTQAHQPSTMVNPLGNYSSVPVIPGLQTQISPQYVQAGSAPVTQQDLADLFNRALEAASRRQSQQGGRNQPRQEPRYPLLDQLKQDYESDNRTRRNPRPADNTSSNNEEHRKAMTTNRDDRTGSADDSGPRHCDYCNKDGHSTGYCWRRKDAILEQMQAKIQELEQQQTNQTKGGRQ